MKENVATTLPPGIALLNETVEDTHDFVIITDADGVPIWANEAFARLEAGTILHALRERQPVKTQLLRRAKNGDPVWFDLEISPLFDAACRLGGFVAI